MVVYKNLRGGSGVAAYNIGSDFIDVQFKNNPRIYRYSYRSANSFNVEQMKKLANDGYGLNSFIMRNAYGLYEK